MTREQTIVPLRWPGAQVIEAARAALGKGRPVEIELPLEMHYALFMHLHPGAPRGSVEPIDTLGGEEVLAHIATVAGLEGIEQLAPALKRAHYRVRLTSPEPTLSLMPPSSEAVVEPGEQVRKAMIAEAAYYRAEKHGFAPGMELDDWFEAEKEIDALTRAAL